MLYRSSLAWGLLMASVMAEAAKKKCYSMNGVELDSRYQPCFPDAEHSACCALNGTSAQNGQNDICMDSGLCMSTSGWWSTFLYANGCTDQTGAAAACPQQCSFMPRPSEYSYNVLQCNADHATFCCRAGGDVSNCCNTSAVFQAGSTIGQILLPGTVETVNTTYSTVYDSGKSDKSAVVGGAVGGILGAALIASLIALFLSLRSRKALKANYNTLQQERESAAQYSANEKAALQQQLDQQQLHYQQYQQQTQAPTYSAAHLPYVGYHSPALPMGSPSMHGYPSEISAVSRPAEMDTMRGASELSSETISQDVERIEENPKKVD